jgi:heme/copper-type cytochrome/quinol oxidase subunit 2
MPKPSATLWTRHNLLIAGIVVLCFSRALAVHAQAEPRVIEILADHDSRFKIAGHKEPMIQVKAGEEVRLRITAKKAHDRNRDGSVHGFALLRAKDRSVVPGWDLTLKPGTQEFTLTAPSEAGDYVVVCTVICSEDHEQMHMKFIVVEP